jgi:hypothetical protein
MFVKVRPPGKQLRDIRRRIWMKVKKKFKEKNGTPEGPIQMVLARGD